MHRLDSLFSPYRMLHHVLVAHCYARTSSLDCNYFSLLQHSRASLRSCRRWSSLLTVLFAFDHCTSVVMSSFLKVELLFDSRRRLYGQGAIEPITSLLAHNSISLYPFPPHEVQLQSRFSRCCLIDGPLCRSDRVSAFLSCTSRCCWWLQFLPWGQGMGCKWGEEAEKSGASESSIECWAE